MGGTLVSKSIYQFEAGGRTLAFDGETLRTYEIDNEAPRRWRSAPYHRG